MKEIKSSEQSGATGKAAYVKPTMENHELEVEQCILVGSGINSMDGGSWGEPESYVTPTGKSAGSFWEDV